jgi:glutamate/tyrosine decarboxylase-like PLP-dependent enzyme
MAITASYLLGSGLREPNEYVPEASRRARGFAIYAALRHLGRRGLADLVDRCCEHAARFAEILGDARGVEVLNDVTLNQVLVAFAGPDGRDRTDQVIGAVQRDGTCWTGGTTWHDRRAMRISVSGWATTGDDVERSARAILAAAGQGS